MWFPFLISDDLWKNRLEETFLNMTLFEKEQLAVVLHFEQRTLWEFWDNVCRQNCLMAINFLVSLLKKNWNNVSSPNSSKMFQ